MRRRCALSRIPSGWLCSRRWAWREPLNATEAAEIIGESPSACSFHFRMLAKYGLVEDAGGDTGRRRPWRRASPAGFMFPAVSDDPQAGLAASALSDVLWGRYLDRARTVLGRGRRCPRSRKR